MGIDTGGLGPEMTFAGSLRLLQCSSADAQAPSGKLGNVWTRRRVGE